jgi:hypothetical protein
MSGGVTFVIVLMSLVMLPVLITSIKDKEATGIFFSIAMIISLVLLAGEDMKKSAHKAEVLYQFNSMRPIYCKDGGVGSSKYIRVLMQDGFTYNKQTESFESNSTVIKYSESALCYIKDEDK